MMHATMPTFVSRSETLCHEVPAPLMADCFAHLEDVGYFIFIHSIRLDGEGKAQFLGDRWASAQRLQEFSVVDPTAPAS
jgi:hypothetical protein